MKKPKDYLLREEFEAWLKENGIKTANQYSRLGKYPGTNYLYYDVIASFLYNDEPIFAFTVLEKWYEEIKKTIGSSTSPITYWNRYKEFIYNKVDGIFTIKNASNVIPDENLNAIRRSLKKNGLVPLDGMDPLISHLGLKGFIKLAVETSLFIDKEIVDDRFNEISDAIKVPQTPLPARKCDSKSNRSEGWHVEVPPHLFYEDENGTRICPITIDPNGNAKVCSVINEYTGYNLNVKLEEKPFQNFVISHIWGRAIDPRYFTNLWNVVLVPAWANHLLDKNDTFHLSSVLKDTFKSICINYYQLNRKNWPYLKMSKPVSGVNAQNGSYTIQVIGRKSGRFPGRISTITV